MNNDFKSDLSRRAFMRSLGIASVAAGTLPAAFAMQQPQAPQAPAQGRRQRGAGGDNGGDFGERVVDPLAVMISSNENPLGPSAGAREAIAKVGCEGGRYNRQYQQEVVSTFSQQMSLKPGYVALYPGSGGALDLAVYSSLLGGKDLVVGEPSYEQAPSAGAKMKVNVHRIPLKADGAYDIDAMLVAGTNASCFYVCNPNNPTGTMTPKAEIIRLVKNKPAGSVVIVDEAYHHFSPDESSIDLVSQDQDVIVLRTFSKIYGMAGLRAGFMIGRPDLQQKVRLIGTGAGTGTGSGSVAISTAAACTASIKDTSLIATRRKINKDIRENTLEFMDKNGYHYMAGSQANFFQVDVKRPGPEFSKLMTAEHIHVGRTWKAMPNYIRVTVGTQPEMDKFMVAFKKCYETAPQPVSAWADHVDHWSELDFNRNA